MTEIVAKYHKILTSNIENDISLQSSINDFNILILNKIKTCISIYKKDLGFFKRKNGIKNSNLLLKELSKIKTNITLSGFLLRLDAILRRSYESNNIDDEFLSLICAANIYNTYLRENILSINEKIKKNIINKKLSDFYFHFIHYEFQYIIDKNKDFDPLNIHSTEKNHAIKNLLKTGLNTNIKYKINSTDSIIQFNKISELIILLDLCILFDHEKKIKFGIELKTIKELKNDLLELVLFGIVRDNNQKIITQSSLIYNFYINKYKNKFKNIYFKNITIIILKYIKNCCINIDYNCNKAIFNFKQKDYKEFRGDIASLKRGACFAYVILLLEFYAIKFDNANNSYEEIKNYFTNIESYKKNLVQKLALLMDVQHNSLGDFKKNSSDPIKYADNLLQKIGTKDLELYKIYQQIEFTTYSVENNFYFETHITRKRVDDRFMNIIKCLLEVLQENKNKIFKTIFPTKGIWITDLINREKKAYEQLWHILMDINNTKKEAWNSNIMFIYFGLEWREGGSHAVSLYINKKNGWFHFFDPNYGLFSMPDVILSPDKFSNFLIQRIQNTYTKRLEELIALSFDILNIRSREIIVY